MLVEGGRGQGSGWPWVGGSASRTSPGRLEALGGEEGGAAGGSCNRPRGEPGAGARCSQQPSAEGGLRAGPTGSDAVSPQVGSLL